MKKVLCLGLVSLFSVASLAAKTPQSACRVKHNGHTIDLASGDEFFQMAHEIAQQENRCVHAKIAYLNKSGRVYSGRENGKLLETRSGKKRDLSNEEAAEAARLSKERCTHLSCDEIGILRGNEPVQNEVPAPVIVVPSYPSSGGGGY